MIGSLSIHFNAENSKNLTNLVGYNMQDSVRREMNSISKLDCETMMLICKSLSGNHLPSLIHNFNHIIQKSLINDELGTPTESRFRAGFFKKKEKLIGV